MKKFNTSGVCIPSNNQSQNIRRNTNLLASAQDMIHEILPSENE